MLSNSASTTLQEGQQCSVSTQGIIQCAGCSKQFDKKMHFNRHWKTIHEKPFKCSICQQTFGLKSGLERHAGAHDPRRTEFKCSLSNCTFKAVRADNLRRHMLSSRAHPETQYAGMLPEEIIMLYRQSVKTAETLIKSRPDSLVLFEAAATGDIALAQTELQKGSDVDALINEGRRRYTALWKAASNGHIKLVQLLLDNHASPDVGGSSESPLLAAIKHGHHDIVQLLIKEGARTELDGYFIYLPLMYALDGGDTSMVQILLQNGIDINKEIRGYLLPLAHAVKEKKKEMVQFLLDQGADIHLKVGCGQTVLHLAAGTHDEEMVRILIANGADIHAKDDFNRTVLFAAATAGDKQLVRLFIRLGVDVNAIGNQKKQDTALCEAAAHGHREVVQILLDNGATIYPCALTQAVYHGKLAVAEILVENGANVNVSGWYNHSWYYAGSCTKPLSIALDRRNKDMVKYLMEKGAEADEVEEQEEVRKLLEQS